MYHENKRIWKHGVNEGCLLIRWLKLYCLNWRPWGFLPCATLMTPKPKKEKKNFSFWRWLERLCIANRRMNTLMS